MTDTPTPDTLKQALRRIACGHKTNPAGNGQRISRGDLINTARTVCDLNGWPYDLAGVDADELGDE